MSVKCLLQVASSPQLNPHYQHASAERPTQSVVTSLPSRMFPNCAELLHTFVEKRDKEGHTAEYYATQKRFPSIQRLLAKYATHTLPFELRGGCYFELWIALPCVLEWSAVAIISWLPFVWALCCLCILAIVTSSLARPYFPGMRVVNGLGVGWFLANWLLALFLYFTKIIQGNSHLNILSFVVMSSLRDTPSHFFIHFLNESHFLSRTSLFLFSENIFN